MSPLARANGFSSPRGLTNDGGRADVTLTAGKKLFDGALRISGFVNYRHTDAVDYRRALELGLPADPDRQGRPAVVLAVDLFDAAAISRRSQRREQRRAATSTIRTARAPSSLTARARATPPTRMTAIPISARPSA